MLVDGALWRVVRPDHRRASRAVHAPWVLTLGGVWGLSFAMPYVTTIRWCLFLRWTGYPCMFCGLTRSFAGLSQGAWSFALHNAPVAVLWYAGLLVLLGWHATGWLTGTVIQPGHRLKRLSRPWLVAAVAGLLLINWAYRLALGLQ